MRRGETLAEEVQALAGLDFPTLRAEWKRRWGEVPKFRSRDLLARATAYRLQAAALGDLPAPTKRKLAELADRFTADRDVHPRGRA